MRTPFSLPRGTEWTPAGFATPDQQKLNRRKAATAQNGSTIAMAPGLSAAFRISEGSYGSTLSRMNVQVNGPGDPVLDLDISNVPRLESGQGLVLTPWLSKAGDTIKVAGGVDPMQLRAGALLWQHIVFPTNNVLDIAAGPDAAFLRSVSAASGASATLSGTWDVAMAATDSILEIVEALRARDGDRWSVSRGATSLTIVDEVYRIPSATFALHQAIPIPDRDVPLDDVLEFRHRRRDELDRLQDSITETTVRIAAEPDQAAAQKIEATKLASAIDDHLKAAREARFPFRIASVETKIDLKTWEGASRGYKLAEGHSVPIQLASGLLGAVLASVSVKPGFRRRAVDTPYEYIWRYHRELFGQ